MAKDKPGPPPKETTSERLASQIGRLITPKEDLDRYRPGTPGRRKIRREDVLDDD